MTESFDEPIVDRSADAMLTPHRSGPIRRRDRGVAEGSVAIARDATQRVERGPASGERNVADSTGPMLRQA